jgi:hypothetical protein
MTLLQQHRCKPATQAVEPRSRFGINGLPGKTESICEVPEAALQQQPVTWPNGISPP